MLTDLLPPAVLVVGALGIFLWATGQLALRRQMAQAQRDGLYPPAGQRPSLQDVERLAQAGRKILAVKLYRQLHRVDLKTAKDAVEALATRSNLARNAPRHGA